MSYSMQGRIHFIDNEIRGKLFPGVKSLARKLGVSERTIHRDLQFLRDSLGAPLSFDRENNGYYYRESTWSLPAILFTEKELLALLIARESILHYAGVPYESYLRQAFEKIVKYIPEDKAFDLGEIEKMYSFRFSGSRPVDPETLDCINRALKKNRTIKIVYYTATRDDETERAVDPYHLDNLRGDWYLIGYCHLREDIRTFALNRIKKCYVLARHFEPDPDFDYGEYIKNAFGIMRAEKPTRVVVEFSGFEAILARERTWHESQRVEDRGDRVVVQLEVTGLEEVKRWILSGGCEAKVLEPAWFADEIKKEFEKARENYD